MTRDAYSPAATAIACIAAAFACVIGMSFGTYSAADTDPYGYVSQADLIAARSMRIELNPAMFPVIPGNEAAWAPAGYVIARDHRSVVPMYPPGLPLVMALLQRVTGERTAAFYVVPAISGLAVVLTYLLGLRFGGATTGAMAAVLLATSPVTLANAVQPVSDIPATAWWTAALLLILSEAPALSLLGGLSASLAVMTRPHLVPLVAVIAIYLVHDAWRAQAALTRLRWTKVAWFAVGTLPGCLAVAAVNQYLHGSPLQSGYGALSDLFRIEHVVPNLDRYPRWLLQTTPVVYLALLAPLVTRRHTSSATRARTVWLLLAWCGVVVVLTFFYGYFGRDEWGYARLLLPAAPAMLVLSAVVAQHLVSSVRSLERVKLAVLVVVAAGFSLWQLRQTDRLGVFDIHEAERRYVDVGMFIAGALPQSAVFVAGLHSGSIRYYSSRMTIYYPRLRQGSLDLAIQTLEASGREVYVVLEDGERSSFSARFATSAFAQLDWPPAERTSQGVPVSIWRIRDRTAFIAGTPVITGDLSQQRKPPS